MTTTEVRRPEVDPTVMVSEAELQAAQAVLSTEIINEYRAHEYGLVLDARTQVFEQEPSARSHENINEALTSAETAAARDARARFLHTFGLNADSQIGLVLQDILGRYSVRNVSAGEWYYGPLLEDGSRDTDKIGQNLFEQDVRSMLQGFGVEFDHDTENNDTPEEQTQHDDALNVLAQKRKALADISLQRSLLTRKNSKRAKELAQAYKQAEDAYKHAYLQAGTTAITLLKSEGSSDEEIRDAVALGTVSEAIAKTADEKKLLESDQSRKAKVARFLARRGMLTGTNIVGGAAIGYGIGRVLKGAAAVAAAPLAPAVLGFGIATKTAKGVLQAKVGNHVHQHTMFEKRAEEDRKTIEEQALLLTQLTGSSLADIDDLAERSLVQLTRAYENRIEANRQYNMKRAVTAAAVSGAAAVAAAVVADQFVHKSSGSRPSTGRPSGGNTHPTGGGRPSVGEINHPTGGNTGVTISAEEAKFLEEWKGMSESQQINFIKMMGWQQRFIEHNGLMNDPHKYEKSIKAFVKGVRYMSKLEAARRGAA